MVELTHGGTWMKWSGLSRADRNWALLSFIAAGLGAIPIGLIAGEWGYRAGYRLGSGGEAAPIPATSSLFASDAWSYVMLASTVLAAVSAFAWWRFSRNQDEMFNRIQNYAIGQAGGWTLVLAAGWWLLSVGGWLGPLPLAALVAFGLALLLLFWFRAVRRWL